VDATGHLILYWISSGLGIGKPQLVHFGGSIDIRIALLLATLGAPCPPRRNVFGGALGHSNRPPGMMSG
jgi:hypothetical protein